MAVAVLVEAADLGVLGSRISFITWLLGLAIQVGLSFGLAPLLWEPVKIIVARSRHKLGID